MRQSTRFKSMVRLRGWLHSGHTRFYSGHTARAPAAGAHVPELHVQGRSEQRVFDGCGQHSWITQVAELAARIVGGSATSHGTSR